MVYFFYIAESADNKVYSYNQWASDHKHMLNNAKRPKYKTPKSAQTGKRKMVCWLLYPPEEYTRTGYYGLEIVMPLHLQICVYHIWKARWAQSDYRMALEPPPPPPPPKAKYNFFLWPLYEKLFFCMMQVSPLWCGVSAQ